MRHRLLYCGIMMVLGSLLGAFVATPVEAHWADLAVAEIVVGAQQVQMMLTFPTGLVATADDNRDGQISSDEVRAHRTELQRFLGDRISLTDGRRAGLLTVKPSETAPSMPNLNVAPGTHSSLLLVYSWPQPIQEVTIRYGLFVPGVSTASCLATILYRGKVRSFVFTPEHRELSLSSGRALPTAQIGSFLRLGITHILTGYDHILFLVSLLMLGGGLRYLLKVVTAFTVAHSLTLSLAVLNVVTLPSRWVESAIALSIIYVAAENFWRKDVSLRQRWLITFGFGLIHGLGFASILTEMNVPRAHLALSLVSFNLGVEVGQVAIVTAAFLLLHALRTVPWESTLRRWISAGAVAMGLVWFVQRAFFGS